MTLDPCNATNVPGIYGSTEGLLARLKSNTQLVGGTCGFILWAPDFHNQEFSVDPADYPQGQNLWTYSSDDPSQSPSNTATLPYGGQSIDAAGTTTSALADPAYQLVSQGLIQDARIISACLQMTYYGAAKNSAGEVAYLSNLPLDALLTGAQDDEPLSVNWLMNYATNKRRLGIDTLENVYRLNEQSSDKFKDTGDFAITLANGEPAVVDQTSSALAPRVFGFAWRNIDASEGLSFDLTKSIEWRAKPSSGLTQTHIHRTGSSKVPLVNSYMDWLEAQGHEAWERVKTSTRSAAAQIATTAQTAVLEHAGDVFRQGLNMGNMLEPLLLV
jgi:hypothetical protein